jgi:hypothetical protein
VIELHSLEVIALPPKGMQLTRCPTLGDMPDYQRSQRGRHGRCQGWSGAGLDIAPGVGLMYSMGHYSGHAYLHVAVLMHHEHVHGIHEPPPLVPPPPPGTEGGGGAAIGPYMLICHRIHGQRQLYVGGEFLLSLEDSNVVLLEEAGRAPRIIATHQIDDDFSRIGQSQTVSPLLEPTFADILKERLYGLPTVREFISR